MASDLTNVEYEGVHGGIINGAFIMEAKIAYVERRGSAMRKFLSFMASHQQQAKAAKLDAAIAKNPEEVGYGG